MGPRFVKGAALFYGFLVVAAVLWNELRGRAALPVGELSLGLGLGAATAAGTVALGLLSYRSLPVLRRLADELAPVLVDGVSRRDLILLSIFSGVGEEAFFRGAVQQEFGLIVASLVFGLAHIGPDRRYLVWTIWAVLAGFLFGTLYETTGGLLAPMVAHALHNATTFVLWKRQRERPGSAKRS